MQSEPHFTLIGNIAVHPRTGSTGQGAPWTKFRLATNSRFFDRAQNEWRDGRTLYIDVMCYRRLAENVASCLHRGDPVVATGKLRQRSWEDQHGTRHEVLEMEADAVGVDLAKRKAPAIRPAATETRPAMGSEADSAWPQPPGGDLPGEVDSADSPEAAGAEREPAWS